MSDFSCEFFSHIQGYLNTELNSDLASALKGHLPLCGACSNEVARLLALPAKDELLDIERLIGEISKIVHLPDNLLYRLATQTCTLGEHEEVMGHLSWCLYCEKRLLDIQHVIASVLPLLIGNAGNMLLYTLADYSKEGAVSQRVSHLSVDPMWP